MSETDPIIFGDTPLVGEELVKTETSTRNTSLGGSRKLTVESHIGANDHISIRLHATPDFPQDDILYIGVEAIPTLISILQSHFDCHPARRSPAIKQGSNVPS